MGLDELHIVMFNAYVLFSGILGVWASVTAARGESISGNFWGSVATLTLLAAAILVVGIIMTLSGLRPRDGRLTLYFLYMGWLVVILPGLFSMLRGRDDRNAALAFALLAFFNAGVGFSMGQRFLTGGWIPG